MHSESRNILKKIFPHLTALFVFMAAAMCYFAPQYEGKDIRQFDNIQAQGMGASVADHIEKYGEHPNWIANMFGGMPSYPITLDYGHSRVINDAAKAFYFIGKPAAYYFILMAGFYFMLLCFGVNPWLALAGGLGYGFSSYFLIIYEAGHIMKLVALAYVAPLIGSIYLSYTRSLKLGAPLTGFFMTLEIASVHPQITYYFIYAILAMVIAFGVDAYRSKAFPAFLKKSCVVLLFGLLAVGANSMYLYYTNDYTKDSTRGHVVLTQQAENPQAATEKGLDKEYITAWSYGKMESFNLFIPNLMGGTSNGGFAKDGDVAESLEPYHAAEIAAQIPAYWGPQPMTSGPVYIGAVMIFLFCMGIFLVKGSTRVWILSVSVLALLLAWGKHFMPLTDLFIDYVPLYNKFRTVSMILVVLQLTLPLLGILALQRIWSGEATKQETTKALRNALFITGGIALFFLLLGGMIFDFSSPSDAQYGLPDTVAGAMQTERLGLLRADAFRSLFFVLLTACVVWLFAGGRMKRPLFIAALCGIVLLDMVPVGTRYLSYDHFVPKREALSIRKTEADKQILQDSDINYRVANLSVSTFNDATTSKYHRSVGGYFAAKPRRYQDVIDRYLAQMYLPAYNMLNTKYFIVPTEQGAPVAQLNPEAFGNGWFADSIAWVSTPDEEIGAIRSVDLRSTAIVSEEFRPLLEGKTVAADSTATFEHTAFRANRMEYKIGTKEGGLALFSEIYYPKGWKAYIDGEEVPYLRADYLLNALWVPAGEHTVLFEFKAPHLQLLKTINYTCSLLILFSLIGAVALQIRDNRKRKEEQNA